MRDHGTAVLRPAPVGAAIEVVRDPPDFGFVRIVLAEIGGCGEHAGEEQGGIDGGKLALPDPFPRLHVEEMVVEALVAGGVGLGAMRRVAEETQRGQRAGDRVGAAHIAARHAHRIGGQRKAGRSDRGRRARRRAIGHQSVLRIGFLGEIVEREALEIAEKRVLRLFGRSVHPVILADFSRVRSLSFHNPA